MGSRTGKVGRSTTVVFLFMWRRKGCIIYSGNRLVLLGWKSAFSSVSTLGETAMIAGRSGSNDLVTN